MKALAANLSLLLAVLPYLGAFASATPALSQPITPAPDGTGTAVTPQGNTFNIQGGSLSRDGANLFHSFQKFGLSQGQIANFISNPDIRNILGRVVGGDASYINGLIQVSGGNSNLFLMNPAGILFGPNASLNVPASFTATAATGIGFGSGWFNAVGSNDYNILVGTPSAFNFAVSQPGAIVNEGNLSLTSGNSLTLLGGTVINTGTLTSPGGNITIAAVPGESAVRISQEGHLLSLDIEPVGLRGTGEGGTGETPVLQMTLPQLLTGRPDFGHASALSVSEKGEVSLTGSGVRIPASGGIAAGKIDTSSEVGNGGAITLSASSDIITGSLRTAAGGTGTGGNIEIVSSAGGINTSAGAVDSSSVDGNGGNVTLTAERDIVTGEIKSGSGEITSLGTGASGWELFLSTGGSGKGGNITLESRSGAIDTSAGNLSSYSLESDGGSVTLTASGDIKTSNIASSLSFLNPMTYNSFGTGTGTGGNITLESRSGAVDTSAGTLSSYSLESDGGSVTLSASGDIKTGNIISSSGYSDLYTGMALGTGTGSGGDISLTSSAGGIDTAGGKLDSSSIQGNGGSVTLTASGDIKTSNILSYSEGTGSGGNIALNSRAGGINTINPSNSEFLSKLDSSSFEGKGGSVTLTASGDIKTSDIFSSSSSSSSSYSDSNTGTHVSARSGGDIAITSRAGGIDTTKGSLSSSSIEGNAGSVTLTASGDIKTASISLGSYGTGSGGNITLNSSAGGIDTANVVLYSSSKHGNGGPVTLTAYGDIKTSNILSYSGNSSPSTETRVIPGSGGNITLNSRAGAIDTAKGVLESYSTQGNGGAVTLTAGALILTGNINSSGLLQGGDITITSHVSDIINRGFLDPSSENGSKGQIAVTAYAGSISTGNFSGPRNITIAGGGKDDPDRTNPNASVTAGANFINTRSGNVTLLAHNDITVSQPIKTDSITSLELQAGRSININADIDTSGSNGNITLRGNYNGVNLNYRGTGSGNVTMAPGTTLNAGSGNIVIELGTLGKVGHITLNNINTTGSLTVNAATGNILRSSADSLITAGRAFFTTSILDSGGIGSLLEPLRISVSNLEARSGSGGVFFDSPSLGVTVGNAADLPIGIMTSGGGDVAISAAGAITILEPVRTASLLSGNAGNITFTSTGAAIDTRTSSLNSSATEGNGGSVTLTASGDITTGNIESYSQGTGSGGNIELKSNLGGIDTSSGTLSSYSWEGDGGSVTLTASGDIQTADIESSCQGYENPFARMQFSGTGSGGNIALNSSNGEIDTTKGGLSSYSNEGNGGSVTLTASWNIKTGSISSFSQGTGSGGNIAINSSNGAIDTTTQELSSFSIEGNGGSLTLTASGDIKTGNILSYSMGTGTGGSMEIKSSLGGINTTNNGNGRLSSSSREGNGGSVKLTASGDIETGNIELYSGADSGENISLRSHGGAIDTASGSLSSFFSQENGVSGFPGTGGNITITSISGGVDTSTGALNTMSSGGAAGNVTINAAGHISTSNIRSDGFLHGGDITINSDSPNSISVGGNLDTYSSQGTAGTVTLTSPGRITLTGDITSYGQTKSGDISVSSNSTITTTSIKTQSGNGPAGNITINGNNIAAGNLDSLGRDRAGNIQVRAGGNVRTLNIESRAESGDSGNIGVEAGGDINTGNQTTSATNGNSGNITDTAGNNITTGNQTTSATNGNSGNITNTAGNNITTGNQTTTANNGNSGNITNTAGNNITTGNQTTTATGGTAGNITNTAVGSITAGDITSTGTNGSGNITLTSATGEINTGAVHTDTGEVNINAGINPLPVPVPVPDSTQTISVPDSTQTKPVLSNPLIQSVSSDSSINPNISSRPTPAPDNNNTTVSNSAQQILTSLNVSSSSPLAVNSAETIAQLEQSRGREFANYFGSDISNQLITTESIREALSTIASQTGYRSAIIYVTALSDQLELVVFTPEGQPIRKTVPAASREELLKVVVAFRNKVTNPLARNSTSYLPPAQQLYNWLIAPIEPELQAAKIDTLLFSMDAGLRGLPVAALHDGKQFLVEKYSLALIPSVSLMDTRYQPLQGKQVLAMGASEFAEQKPLPAVPVELEEITHKLWQGKAFLNQDFTRDNLMGQRNSYPYPIIHLATHAEFLPGAAKDSYIQLWDDKLGLDQLRNLRLNSPPVELLVLSACRTAVGDEKAELGFAGFAVAAGVKTAVASLWYVSDAGTLGLMAEFYQHLADAKIKAEALRQAQLAMIRGDVRIEEGELRQTGIRAGVSLPAELLKEGNHNLKHPYYWSGFTMIGSPW